jgi:hypothetical protein
VTVPDKFSLSSTVATEAALSIRIDDRDHADDVILFSF